MSKITTTTTNNVLVIKFKDPRIVEEPRIREISEQLNALLKDRSTSAFLLSFQDVDFMGSAMIGRIIDFKKKCEDDDVKLGFCDISNNIMEAITILQLHKRWKIYESEFQAVASLGTRYK